MDGLGFGLKRDSGSHHIYVHSEVPELINLQEVDGQAKPYQVRQVMRLVERVRFESRGQPVKDYHINCFYSEEDGGWIADIPDLEACSVFGQSPQEAVAEVLKAKEAWLATATAEGRSIPPPTYRPALYAAH